jgi:hypothetical protein
MSATGVLDRVSVDVPRPRERTLREMTRDGTPTSREFSLTCEVVWESLPERP